MDRLRAPGLQDLGRLALVMTVSLSAATLAVAILEELVGVPHASAVYLAAVVASALLCGTWGGIASAVASFFIYNFLFTDPRLSLWIADSREWLSAVLLLFVGIVVGELTALQRRRADEALTREREARALNRVSRELATRESTPRSCQRSQRSSAPRPACTGSRSDWATIRRRNV